MKKMFAMIMAGVSMVACAAQWQPGTGVANDHATGANAQDVRFVARDGVNGYGYGLDLGTFSDARDFAGVAINWCGNVADSATGLQIGLVNAGRHARGLQIGLVNHVERLDGVQIGLLNFARSQWSIPLVNIGW